MNLQKFINIKTTVVSMCILLGLLLSNCTPFISPQSQVSSYKSNNNHSAVYALAEEDLPFGFNTVSPDNPASVSLLTASQSIADLFIFGELSSIQHYRYSANDDFAQITSGIIEPVVAIERALFDLRLTEIENSPGILLPTNLKKPVILTPGESVTPIQLFLTGTLCQVTCRNNDLIFDLFIGRSKSTVFFVYYLHNPGINLPIDIFELSKILVFKNHKLRQTLE